MAIKDVLAVVDTGDRDEQFLRDALGFAEFHNASLSLVILSALPSADYALTIARPYAFLQDYTEAVEAKQQRIAALAGSTNVEVRTISRSEEHTSELQSLMRISYAVFCLKKKKKQKKYAHQSRSRTT